MKAHFVSSETRLVEGQPCTALCQAEIRCSVFCFYWDELEIGIASMLELPKGGCDKCRLRIGDAVKVGYIYGVSEKTAA